MEAKNDLKKRKSWGFFFAAFVFVEFIEKWKRIETARWGWQTKMNRKENEWRTVSSITFDHVFFSFLLMFSFDVQRDIKHQWTLIETNIIRSSDIVDYLDENEERRRGDAEWSSQIFSSFRTRAPDGLAHGPPWADSFAKKAKKQNRPKQFFREILIALSSVSWSKQDLSASILPVKS